MILVKKKYNNFNFVIIFRLTLYLEYLIIFNATQQNYSKDVISTD